MVTRQNQSNSSLSLYIHFLLLLILHHPHHNTHHNTTNITTTTTTTTIRKKKLLIDLSLTAYNTTLSSSSSSSPYLSISNDMSFRRSLAFSATFFFLLFHGALSFYLPGVAPQDFLKVPFPFPATSLPIPPSVSSLAFIKSPRSACSDLGSEINVIDSIFFFFKIIYFR